MNAEAKVGAEAPEKKSNTKLLIGGGVLGLLLVVVLVVLALPYIRGGEKDIAGVWKSQSTGVVYVIEKVEDDYRLSAGGHRLAVKEVAHDSLADQLNLTVKTDSGLLAVWSFRLLKDDAGKPLLRLDQDGLATEDLGLQRQLTSADKARLAQLKFAKKPLWAPAFDCGKAATDVERMLCTDPTLAAADVTLSQTVKRMSLANPSLKDDQKGWLTQTRNACGDMTCLRNAYEMRQNDLNASESEGYSESEEAEAPEAADAPAT